MDYGFSEGNTVLHSKIPHFGVDYGFLSRLWLFGVDYNSSEMTTACRSFFYGTSTIRRWFDNSCEYENTFPSNILRSIGRLVSVIGFGGLEDSLEYFADPME